MKVHIVQIIVIHIVMGLSGARIFLKGGPVTRTNTMSLGIVSQAFPTCSFCSRQAHQDDSDQLWRSLFNDENQRMELANMSIYIVREIHGLHHLPNRNSALGSRPGLGFPESQRHPQRSRARLLGRCGLHVHPG